MYDFAVLALLALAVVKVVDFTADQADVLARVHSLATFALGIGAVWLLDYSVFEGWGVAVRDDTLGVVMTGFIVSGLTVPWRAVFGFLTHDRATADETLGDHHRLLQRAA